MGLVFVFALSLVSQSGAQNKHLKGEYAVVGEATCRTHWLVNPDGGTTSTYFVHSASAQGTDNLQWGWNWIGTNIICRCNASNLYSHPNGSLLVISVHRMGYLGERVRAMSYSSLLIPSHQMERISRTITTLEGTFTSGPHAGKTFTQSPFTLTGFVSKDKGTILLSSVPGQAEIITSDIFDEDGSFYGRREQECHRSRVLTLISK